MIITSLYNTAEGSYRHHRRQEQMTNETTRSQVLECRSTMWGSGTSGTPGAASGRPDGAQPRGPRSPGDSGLRVSDAERQATADQLKANFTAGRLDMDEYEQRLQQTLGARTRGELDDVLKDLPAIYAGPVHQPRGHPFFVPVLIAIAALVALTTLFGVAHGFFFPWWIIPIAFFLWSRHWRRRWYPGYWGPAK
jgi:hypothetical protein